MKTSLARYLAAAFCLFCLPLLNPSQSLAQVFTTTGNMTNARDGQTATLLNNGLVLIVGGSYTVGGRGGGTRYLATAELYNPATGLSTATGSMTNARASHTATLLQNGMVLVAGGQNSSNFNLSGAEIYNPATGTFALTGNLITARHSHTATLLQNGTVLIAGGGYSSAELYNPGTGAFTATGSLNTFLEANTATLLNNGNVLIAGNYNSGVLATAYLYNPANGTFTSTGNLNTGRIYHTATLLSNGTVLIAGGCSTSTCPLSSAELYNPVTGTFTTTGSLHTGRYDHSATLLANGTVLLIGGVNGNYVAQSELYSSSTGTFSTTGSLNTARCCNTSITMDNGSVLVTGGVNGSILSSEEIYSSGFQMGYVNPKYVVVGVTYAPPGPSSNTSVSYGSSTFIGTTNSVSSSFMTGDSFTVTLSSGISIPLVGSAKITDQYSNSSSQTAKSTSGVTMTFQTSTTEKTFGTGSYWAPVDNDYDTVWVWLNPALIFSVSNSTVVWNGYGIDETDQPGMDIVGIELGYLNGHFGSMPPDIQTSLNRTWAASQMWPSGQGPALTSPDLAQIASTDPFSVSTYGTTYIGYDPPPSQTSDYRFTGSLCTNVASFDYVQAAPSQNSAIYSCTLTYASTSTQAQDITSNYSQTFSVDSGFSGSGFFSQFSLDLKNSNTIAWTTEEQNSITTSNTSTASFSVQGPPCNNQVQGQGPCIPVYDSSGNEPTQFYVYQDNMFGTFMFAPVHFY